MKSLGKVVIRTWPLNLSALPTMAIRRLLTSIEKMFALVLFSDFFTGADMFVNSISFFFDPERYKFDHFVRDVRAEWNLTSFTLFRAVEVIRFTQVAEKLPSSRVLLLIDE